MSTPLWKCVAGRPNIQQPNITNFKYHQISFEQQERTGGIPSSPIAVGQIIVGCYGHRRGHPSLYFVIVKKEGPQIKRS